MSIRLQVIQSKGTTMKRAVYISAILYIISLSFLRANEPVKAVLSRSKLKLGDQTELKVIVSSSANYTVEFPSYDSLQCITPGVEVLSFRDSFSTSGSERVRIYTITSFDTAVSNIPPIEIKVDKTLYSTKELPLKVLSVPIDTAAVEQIFDLKEPMEPSFDIHEWLLPFILSIITLIVGIILTYIIIRIKDNKPIIRRLKMNPYIPPHKAAMAEISKIKEESLSENVDSKTYYTKLTDALRRYMQGRYGINAMEMTTDEIISSIEKVNDPDAIRELSELFTTADLVKFAKVHPDISENDKNLLNAVNYIESTKKEEVKELPPREVVVVDIRSRKAKCILYISIIITLIILALTATYLIKQLYILNY